MSSYDRDDMYENGLYHECRENVMEDKGNVMEDKAFENLKNAVVKFLMANHSFDMDEADEAVSESVIKNPDIWNENADAAEVAKFLASEDDDE